MTSNVNKFIQNTIALFMETYMREEWDQIPTLQKLITSMPRCLQTVLKEEEMLHHGKHASVSTILRPVAGIKFEMISFCAYNFSNSV